MSICKISPDHLSVGVGDALVGGAARGTSSSLSSGRDVVGRVVGLLPHAQYIRSRSGRALLRSQMTTVINQFSELELLSL